MREWHQIDRIFTILMPDIVVLLAHCPVSHTMPEQSPRRTLRTITKSPYPIADTIEEDERQYTL